MEKKKVFDNIFFIGSTSVSYQQNKQNSAPIKERVQLEATLKDQTSTDMAQTRGKEKL